ncbi:double-strand break repair helicase AddA [Rhodovibrionaceae bacterium A322]
MSNAPQPTALDVQSESSRRIQEAAANQRRAADPKASAWVSASAGTGKTKVLTDRVLCLLLAGTAPERLLCLTFTKAAAAEMNNRLADKLQVWATAPAEKVEKELHQLLGAAPTDETLLLARRLFAKVLDVPGGMKIQTIHSFCQSLLGRFPLEAGIAPHFQLLDDLGARARLHQAQEQVFARAGMGLPGSQDLLEALEIITALVNELDFAEVISAIIRERSQITRLLKDHGSVAAAASILATRLGVDPDDQPGTLILAGCQDWSCDIQGLRETAQALLGGGANDQKAGSYLAAWTAAEPEQRLDLWPDYLKAFFTASGSRRAKLVTVKTLRDHPGIDQILTAEADRLETLKEKVNAQILFQASRALLLLGSEILQIYEQQKRDRALLDYDDLILITRDLLQRQGLSAWVLFKLDGGLDHLLIDEAQDTNPEQWEVVRALTSEFFTGLGAAEDRTTEGPPPRTIFAVGDPKQSIYSFQRADPAQFAAMQRYYGDRVRAAHRPWAPVALSHSFRSTSVVLEAVDTLFSQTDNQAGLTFGDRWRDHAPVRVGQAGLIELWPPADPEEQEEEETWAPPTSRSGEAHPRAKLARLIAKRIKDWTQDPKAAPGRPSWLAAQGRPVKPGDILILVRRRNAFVEEVVRELKNLSVPVAGVDRMILTEQLAVMDLVALGRCLLLPEDDLTLATVLKSPLIGLTEEQLFDLAYDRPGSLWSQLQVKASQAGAVPHLVQAYEQLRDLAARVDYVRPFEFYADLLAKGGRKQLLTRLGPEAADPIEEFLSLAVAYESEAVPSLEGFLFWLEAGEQQIKRDMEVGGDLVRVMTVHGAKGLQAPIVFLPDTLQKSSPRETLYWLEENSSAKLPLWRPRSHLDEPLSRAAKLRLTEQGEEEYRRLLYVALTRAEDRLYVCGWNSRRAAPAGNWYHLIEESLKTGPGEETEFDFSEDLADGWQGSGWRRETPQIAALKDQSGQQEAPAETAEKTSATDESAEENLPASGSGHALLPAWAQRRAPAEASPSRPLAPSKPSDSDPPMRSPLGGDKGQRFQRGRLVHRLLQTLPDLPADQRETAVIRFLATPAHRLSLEQQADIARETLAVLALPDLQDLFGPNSRAEAPVVGLIDSTSGGQVVSGQIDRLCVDSEKVLVLDYKTQRPAPEKPAEVSVSYLRQMASYKALLSKVYPGKEVFCALLWTDGPRYMPLSDELLRPHMP